MNSIKCKYLFSNIMRSTKLSSIVNYCDRLLDVKHFNDYEGAVNGLQIQNNGTVSRIGAAVDITLEVVTQAIENKVDLLIVHHGMMWNARQPIVGRRYQMISLMIKNYIALYSVHLPLDAHPSLGNNAQIAKLIGFKKFKPAFPYKGREIGVQIHAKLPREELARRLSKIMGCQPKLISGGPELCKNIIIVSGGAGEELKTAAQLGADTFISGEGPHWTVDLAKELEINLFYCGHYASEVFGVKALAENISKKFKVPWIFIDSPGGL